MKLCQCGRPATHYVTQFNTNSEPIAKKLMCDTFPACLRNHRAAIDQSSPPARQENDDVFKGFRGNNEA